MNGRTGTGASAGCRNRRRNLGGALASALGIAAAATPAAATRLYDPTFSTCTGKNCSSISILAPLLNYGTNANAPWVGEIYVGLGECVGFDISSFGQRYTLAWVPPAEGDIDLCHLCSFTPGYDSTEARWATLNFGLSVTGDEKPGWYTILIMPARASWNGAPPTEPEEEMLPISFGRYNLGNPNCAYVEGNPTGNP